MLFILNIILIFISINRAELTCTQECDLEFPFSFYKVNICGTDGQNHKTPYSALVGLPPPWSCYRDKCDVGMQYYGTCGCPNECYESINRGSCQNSTCVCSLGWKGEDCSLPSCPENKCSSHGVCSTSSSGFDFCKCDDGFTGADCSITTLNIPILPYGEVLPGKYYLNDSYGDEHPVFNLSTIANIVLNMSDEDYTSLLLPSNTWNQSFFKVSAEFSNGVIQQHISHSGIKIKGNWARLGEKKSFRVKFHDKNQFFGISEVELKAPSLDPSYLHNQLIVEYYRSMLVPVSRSCFATVNINGVHWGIFWMNEQMDDNFAISRYGTSSGNMYSGNTYLEYLGDDPTIYQNASLIGNGAVQPMYELEFGDGNWSDFADFAKFLNQSTDEEFIEQITEMVNVEYFIRSMVVESSIDDPDGYTRSGNNWALYHLPSSCSWQYLSKDYELTMIDAAIESYKSVSGNIKAILAHRIMIIPEYKELFIKYYHIFLTEVFDPSLPNSAKNRSKAFVPFLESEVAKDYFYATTNGFPATVNTWKAFVDEIEVWLPLRYEDLKIQFLL